MYSLRQYLQKYFMHSMSGLWFDLQPFCCVCQFTSLYHHSWIL